MQTLKPKVRAKILRAARSEFLKHGFDKASMRRIAKGAGMTVGNIYRYYKNKDDLLFGVVGTKDLTMQLYNADLKGFMILVERKVSKVDAVQVMAENMTVEDLLEVVK